jgi:DNA polymerase-3 subunit chi
MKNAQQPELIFLRVTDNQTKLRRIASTVQQHFVKGERILIIVPNNKAASFVDEFLWKIPEESFLPHSPLPCGSNERVVITEDDKNPNRATIAINLCPEPIKRCAQFERIYELFDQTEQGKEGLSKQKILEYEKMGLELVWG